MPKVYLSRDRVVVVPAEDIERIKTERESKSGNIRVGQFEVSYTDIKGFLHESTIKSRMDLDNPADMQSVLNFERDLKAYEEAHLDTPPNLRKYGYLQEDFRKAHPELEEGFKSGSLIFFKDGVFNFMLGLVPWSYVQFFADHGAIDRYPEEMAKNAKDDGWYVVGEQTEHGWDISKYTEMIALWRALRKLEERRAYAKGQKDMNIKSLMETAPF